ncbi:hypothetical protein [Monoglobus pectinilyticus]|uniref:hypothetical protein n=1 Tax=Monoglobus pectinilyticus TaxID=1981510 RepID=UPI00399AB961
MEVKEAMQKAVRALLSNGSYHDLNEEQKAVVVEFETELWKPKVDEMRKSMSLVEISEVIHNLWLNYEIADETEYNLLIYMSKEKIELNKIFEMKKGNKTLRWKVIKHPYFNDTLVLVRDYPAIKNGVSKEDYNHICVKTTLENAYDDAFVMAYVFGVCDR